ncbi:MAG: hypothetical protein V2A77_07840 [Pseudomonadota bacterium]
MKLKTRRLPAAALGIMLLALGGCGLAKGADRLVLGQADGPYQCAWQEWTRRGNLSRDLSLVLDAQATYRSARFQEAYLRRHAEVYRIQPEELSRQLAEAREMAGREMRVVLVASTGDRRWNDFAKPDSVWRVFLQNDRGEHLAPMSKRHLEDRTEVAGFFPLGQWSEAYEFVFCPEGEQARAFSGGRVSLVLASVLGNAQFEWDVNVAQSLNSSAIQGN